MKRLAAFLPPFGKCAAGRQPEPVPAIKGLTRIDAGFCTLC